MTDGSTRLAVLIDADNTPARLVKELFEELAGCETITVKRPMRTGPTRRSTVGATFRWARHLPAQQFAYTYVKNATEHHCRWHVLPGDDQRRGLARAWVEDGEEAGFALAHSADGGADTVELGLPSLGPSRSVYSR